MTERYRAYDVFARMYDRRWGPQGLKQAGVLDEHVLADVAAGARVLDLCCGTGQLAALLTERGYDVTGIDGSEEMIAYARRNAPVATFVVDDARTFELDTDFEAVLSMFDSLNHLMTEEDLAAAFARVAAVLSPSGVFAFDLNMEPKFVHTWTGDFSFVDDHEACVVKAGVRLADRVGLFDATLFYEEDDGSWSRHDLHLEQTWYDEEVVTRLLTEAGFGVPTTHVKEPLPDQPDVAQNLLFVTRRTDPRRCSRGRGDRAS